NNHNHHHCTPRRARCARSGRHELRALVRRRQFTLPSTVHSLDEVSARQHEYRVGKNLTTTHGVSPSTTTSRYTADRAMGSPRRQIPRHPRLAAAGFLACRLRPLPSGQENSRSTQCAHATIRPLAERLNRTQYNHSSPLRHSHYPTAIYPRQRHPRRRARIQPIPHSACCCRCRHHSRGHLPPLDTASRFTEALDASLRPLVDPGGFFRWM
ncbi:hypothetical protein B0H16DRAFT_1810590, partial [Mycena metata]